MGQKVSPISMRLGINKEFQANWYAEKDFAKFLNEDIKIRKYLETQLKEAALSKVEIQRGKKLVAGDIVEFDFAEVLDKDGNVALTSEHFVAGRVNDDGTTNKYGLVSASERTGLQQLLGNLE